MTLLDVPAPHRSLFDPGKGSRGRKIRNAVWTGLIGLAFVVALIPLVAVVLYVIQQGADQLNWAFLTEPIPIDRAFGPGMGPAVVGTLIITGAAASTSTSMAVGTSWLAWCGSCPK